MTRPDHIALLLLSDTTFAGGSPAGEVDTEVEHDELGLPLIGGKRLHGLLADSWQMMAPAFPDLQPAGRRIMGFSRDLDETAILRIGDAVLPAEVRTWIAWAVGRQDAPLSSSQVLRTLTAVRWQTALSRETGGPVHQTLRASRVVRRNLAFTAPLLWLEPPAPDDLRVLALSVLGARHAGLGRNRGRGFVQMALDGDLNATRALAGLGGELA